ncbi:MAG TPA: phosphoribosyl-AMP cyclohydrolase [Xanthobacteraceae bacterium]|nr:phosphoribosyl-AMP cyclohydrolase [Xanthobacteraceae bacterium]
MSSRFPARGNIREIETGNIFMPKFDEHGLLSCIVTDAGDGALLMFAHMNEEALARTIESGEAWFWSRSRKELWRKGETSGNTLTVADIRVDCDQDAIQLSVRVGGKGVACHTGERSCFFRRLPVKPSVKLSADNPVRLTSIEKPGR